ncbi:MAG: hypothetical protein AAB506_02365 [Patescibacteria group bacterium]
MVKVIMKLLVGLGNPGAKYLKNRHNVGHMFIDFLASQELLLRSWKSDVFMNESGVFVKKYLTNLTNLYIVHDDLDLKLGTYKIQFGVGPKVHNGIKNIEEVLGTKDFWRIRIGVDNRSPANGRETGERYVLEDFADGELKILKGVYAKIRDDLGKY